MKKIMNLIAVLALVLTAGTLPVGAADTDFKDVPVGAY